MKPIEWNANKIVSVALICLLVLTVILRILFFLYFHR